jgi:hypothetical protein
MDTYERERRIQRVTLRQPVPAVASGERAYVVDASMRGVRLSHAALIPQGTKCDVAFEWDGQSIEFEGEVRWTKAERGNAPSMYQSGFQISNIKTDAARVLRGLVLEHVERALDEQRTNARGVLRFHASYQRSDPATLYARHEWIDGVWRRTSTTDSGQPRTGFTVPSSESRHQVLVLRSAYEAADAAMREIIRRLATMTIADAVAVPARRYNP